MAFPHPEPLCHLLQIPSLVAGTKGTAFQPSPPIHNTDVQLRPKLHRLACFSAHNGTNERLGEDFDGNYYSFQISVGKSGKVNTIYNVNRIQKEAALPKALRRSAVQSATVGSAASMDTIAQEEKEVNKKVFSLSSEKEEAGTPNTLKGAQPQKRPSGPASSESSIPKAGEEVNKKVFSLSSENNKEVETDICACETRAFLVYYIRLSVFFERGCQVKEVSTFERL